MSLFLSLNEQFLDASAPVFHSTNRGFRYGDGLFETIRVIRGNPLFLEFHTKRLFKGMNLIKMTVPPHFSAEYFDQQIRKLLEKNNLQGDVRIRLTIFRVDGGYYTPHDNNVSFIIESELINESGYELNIKGYSIDVFPEIKKTPGILASVKSANSLLYVLAGAYKRKQDLDECILLNDRGNIIEAISYNIFAVKNGVLYTPPVNDGCIEGIMRWQIIKIATESRMAVYEINLAMNVLLNSDELFLTNAMNGIRWIGAYKGKRYFNNTSKLLLQKLNTKVDQIYPSN